jgi:hypothetical protein
MTAKRIGVLLAFLHLGTLGAFLIYIHSEAAEQSQAAFYWLIWFPVDFPWSLLNLMPRWAMPDGIDSVLGIPRYRLVEYWRIVVHGAAGTVWWYYLPTFVLAVVRRGQRSQPRN